MNKTGKLFVMMSFGPWKLAVLAIWTLAGLFVFQRGFLLTRSAVKEFNDKIPSALFTNEWRHIKTQVDDSPYFPGQKRPTKAVIVLIDALRFDFAAYQPQSTMQFHNQMTAIHTLLKEQPRNSHLFHFIADPPTTTMQRLKALMTGSLPTFIDAGSNFATGKVPDDHLLEKLKQNNKKFVFMGDDTWLGLYEEKLFHAAFPYPSFEVFDLHTVDNGCLHHIWDYIERHNDTKRVKADWDVLVAHFLGVDHVGHRYGPDHFEMPAKLSQLNGFLDELFKSVDENTIVFVFGDHGMDAKGDHGGDSQLEVDAALFVYGKSGLFYEHSFDLEIIRLPRRHTKQAIKEGDKFISFLEHEDGLGLFNNTPMYDAEYPSISQIDLVPTLATLLGVDIPIGSLGFIVPMFHFRPVEKICIDGICTSDSEITSYLRLLSQAVFNLAQIEEFIRSYNKFTGDLSSVVEKLDSRVAELINSDSLSLLLKKAACIGRSGCFTKEVWIQKAGEVFRDILHTARIMLEVCRRVWARFNVPMIVTGVVILFTVVLYLLVLHLKQTIGFTQVFLLLIVALHSFIFGSNSYVIFEDWVVFFLIQTLSAFLLVTQAVDKTSFLAYVYLLILNRYSFTSTICRDEQLPRCEPTFNHMPLLFGTMDETFNETSTNPKALMLLLMAAFGYPAMITIMVKPHVQVSAKSFSVASYIVLLSMALCWVCEFLEESMNHLIRNNQAAPWFQVLVPSNDDPEARTNLLGNFVKLKIYAARVAFCAVLCFVLHGAWYRSMTPYRVLFACFLLISITQLPVGIVILLVGFLQLSLAIRDFQHPNAASILLVSLLGIHVFFSTGHQVTFSSIQFQTGFIGLESFNFYLSGALVTLNAIGPILVFNFAVGYLLVQSNWKHIGLVLLHRHLLVFMSALFAGFHRRHLMVWNVFAPRFMFSAIDVVLFDVILLSFYFCK